MAKQGMVPSEGHMENTTKYEAMDAYRLEQGDLPDGAFFQLAEDAYGWTADDWLWFSKQGRINGK